MAAHPSLKVPASAGPIRAMRREAATLAPVRAQGSERQRQIVEIALDLVAERGADSVSIQAIADRIGVTQPAIFRHFRDKEAIWIAVMEWLADNLRQIHATAELQSNETPLDVLRRMFLDHIRMVRRYPALAKVVFSDHLRLQRVVDLIGRAKKQKLVPAAISDKGAATLYFCMIQGLGFQFAIARRPMRLAHEAERVFVLYLRGIATQE